MYKIKKTIPSYIFWVTWSIITGGMIISGPVLAPIAFTTMPVTVSPEIAQYAYSYAGTLFTLFFIQYFPIVAGAFLLITILEHFISLSAGKNTVLMISCVKSCFYPEN